MSVNLWEELRQLQKTVESQGERLRLIEKELGLKMVRTLVPGANGAQVPQTKLKARN